MVKRLRFVLLLLLVITASVASLPAQRSGGLSQEQIDRRWALEKELQSIAIVDRKVMMPDVGHSVVDNHGVQLIREWIAKMPGSCPAT